MPSARASSSARRILIRVSRRLGSVRGSGDYRSAGLENVVDQPGQVRRAAPVPADDLAQAALVVIDLRGEAAHGETALAHQGAHRLGEASHVRVPIARRAGVLAC